MKNYIVQFRPEPNRPLVYLLNCYAKSGAHAIIQGAKVLASGGEDACEIVATENA